MEARYLQAKDSLQKKLHGVQGLALTTDSWTSIVNQAYMAVTAHYVSEDSRLQTHVLIVEPLEERHTAKNTMSWI